MKSKEGTSFLYWATVVVLAVAAGGVGFAIYYGVTQAIRGFL